LKDFGIERNQVIWVDNTTDKEMEELISEIAQAEMLAIDTESIVGKNKLERTKCEPASLVQIAFEKKIFILDGLKGKNKKLQETFLDFIAKGKPILGHAIGNDLDATLFSLGFT
jgi:ribonuclease D